MIVLLCLCTCRIVVSRWPAQPVEISEVRSDWGDILYAADGSGHGFIELYNNSDQAVCLDGWYLSDSTLNWDKYQITACTIEPYSYAVFWTNEATDVVGLPVSGYFLGFSLQAHEPVVLTDPRGKVIDSVTIPVLEKENSYATGTSGIWCVRESTPGTANTTNATLTSASVKSPKISRPSGFYEGSVSVELDAAPGCTIYYTLDGTPPDQNSLLYSGPLTLTDPTNQENRYSMLTNVSTLSVQGSIYTPDYAIPKIHVLRAIAVNKKGNVSREVHASYFIDFEGRYGFENVLTLSIITDPDNFFSDELGIYVLGNVWNSNPDTSYLYWEHNAPTNYSVSGKGWRRPVELELFDADRNLAGKQSAGISIHGNWSVVYNHKSFNLYAFSDTEEDTVIFPGVLDSNSSSVMLRAGGYNDLYSTKIRDILNQQLVADRAVTVQDALPCQIFLNGEYWGLYNLQERIDKGLISSAYNVNEKNLVVLKNWSPVVGELEDMQLYYSMTDFISQNDMSIDENYAQVCQMIDVQSCIDYYCFQIYIANCDSIGNNYAIWRTRNVVDDEYGDGRWRWILYDTDDSVGMYGENMTGAAVDSFVEGHWAVDPMEDLLFSSLIKNESFKLQFAQTFEEMAANNFSPARVNEEIDRLCQVYSPATVISHHRFLDAAFTEQDYLDHIQVIKDFYTQRYAYIHDYMVTHLELQNYGY